MIIAKTSTVLKPFSSRLWVVVSNDCEKAAQKLTDYFKDPFEWNSKDTLACTYTAKKIIKGHERNFVIIIFPASTEVPTMAHEAVHAANLAFSHAGAKLDVDNDEPQAYLVDFVVKQILKTFKKYDKLAVHPSPDAGGQI